MFSSPLMTPYCAAECTAPEIMELGTVEHKNVYSVNLPLMSSGKENIFKSIDMKQMCAQVQTYNHCSWI